MPVALALVDEKQRYARVNPAFATLVGRPADEIVGTPVGGLLTSIGDTGDEPVERLRRALLDGAAPETGHFVGPDGLRRWLEWEVVPRIAPGLVLLVARDVTQRRRHELAAELLLALALDVADAPDFRTAVAACLRRTCQALDLAVGEVWVPTREGDRLVRAGFWSRDGFALFGEESEDLVIPSGNGLPGRALRTAATILVPDLLSDAAPFLRAAQARVAGLGWGLAVPVMSGAAATAVLVLLTDREPTDVEEVERTARAAAANLGAALARKRTEELANIQSAIVDDAGTAIIGKTLDGEIVSWNRGAAALYGYDASEVIGRHIAMLAPADRQDEMVELLARLRRGEIIDRFETVRMRKDGVRVRVDLSVSPVRDALGRLWGASALARDVTRERQLEDALRQSQRMESLGSLAGGIAHDFNNLLTVILNEADLLLEGMPAMPTEERRNSLEEIRRTGERAASLTRQLLSFARQEVREPRATDLNTVIRRLEGMLVRVLRSDIRLESSLGEDLWPVFIDQTHVEQVLVNLAVNAREAMAAGGRLEIGTKNAVLDEDYVYEHATVSTGEYVVLTVGDSGIGMSEEVRQRIFDPFFTTRADDGGTGLGLSTCYGIVRQAGGHIWVYSEPGAGTVFKIYLPRAVDAASEASLPADAAESKGSETVLLVEDEPNVRSITVRGLRRFGYRVLVASNGEEALKIAQVHPGRIDVLFTDVVMPVMGGVELAERLRRSRPEVKVLLTSGYTDEEIQRRAADVVQVAVLAKPFVASELATKIRQVLDA